MSNKDLLRTIYEAHLEYQCACICNDIIRMDAAQSALRKWIESIPQRIDYHPAKASRCPIQQEQPL